MAPRTQREGIVLLSCRLLLVVLPIGLGHNATHDAELFEEEGVGIATTHRPKGKIDADPRIKPLHDLNESPFECLPPSFEQAHNRFHLFLVVLLANVLGCAL